MKTALTISKAKISDAQAIRKLEHSVWNEEVVNKYDIPMFVRFGYVYIARHGTKLVGAIVAYRTNKNEVYVCDLVVGSAHRRSRIGERLYQKLLRSVKGKSVVSFLDPQRGPTVRLHEKLGSQVVAKVKDAYGLARGLETGTRLFVRIKN